MVSKDLLKEIKFIALCSLVMDIVLAVAGSFFVAPLNAVLGALYGTCLLIFDMFMLSFSVQKAAKGARIGKNGTPAMIAGYIFRYVAVGAGLYIAVIMPFISVICTAVPLFYPKFIYPAKAIFYKKEG